MNFRLSSLLITFGCVFLASCSPYDESQGKKPTKKQTQKSVTTAEQQKIQEQRDALKQKEAPKTSETPGSAAPSTTPSSPSVNTAPPGNSTPPAPTPPAEGKRPEYKFAQKVPGKDGFVLSPYNGKVVDVRDIPSGTLVQDPTYTGPDKGYFRVP